MGQVSAYGLISAKYFTKTKNKSNKICEMNAQKYCVIVSIHFVVIVTAYCWHCGCQVSATNVTTSLIGRKLKVKNVVQMEAWK